MKRNLLLAVCLFLTLISSGCTQAVPDTPKNTPPATQSPKFSQASKNTIALVMKTLANPFFIEMEKGARQAEKEFGVNLIVKAGAQETSVDEQIAIVEDLIKEKVQAILITPADSVKLVPVLKKAQEAGIVIINLDNQLDNQVMKEAGLANVPFISVDNEKSAYLSAKFVSLKVKSTAQALILEGIPTAKNAQDRKAGAVRAFGENPNIQIVSSETAHWKTDEAYQVTGQVFKKYPDIKLIFCANDMMALGAMRYLKENNLSEVYVAAYDALDEVMPMLKDGSLQVTVDQQAADQAYTGVQFAVRAIHGEKLPPVTFLDALLITRESAR
jgi:ribose transport system substrate-binding protein